MAEIRSAEEQASKWANVTPGRSAEYQKGVQAPKRDWGTATKAALEAYKAGLTASVAKGSWLKGVTRAGTGKWQANSVSKGVQRWGPGVQLAQDDYQRAIGPYNEAIRRTTLPPRFARRDPRNLERVRVIVEALVKTKEIGRASCRERV